MFRALAAEPAASLAHDSPAVVALRRLLLLGMSDMGQFHSLYLRYNIEVSATMRDECLIPKQEQRLILRELNSIDLAIERKTRLLLKIQDARRERRKDRFAGTHSHSREPISQKTADL
jgi:hypothetical protein